MADFLAVLEMLALGFGAFLAIPVALAIVCKALCPMIGDLK